MPVSKQKIEECLKLVNAGEYLSITLADSRKISKEDRVMIGHLQFFRGLIHLFLDEIDLRGYP